MKQFRQILWEKDLFILFYFIFILFYLFIYLFFVIFSSFTRQVHIFRSILLKLVQISCIIIDINPIENKENPSNIMGKGTISNIG